MVKFGIGQAVTRVEDHRLLTGRGTYTDDVHADGTAAAVIVRSPYAHARIKGIDAKAARAAPGVIAVLTHAEVKADGLGDLPCLVPITSRDGSERQDVPRPILEGEIVRHVGTAVALVVAETPAQARDAAELVEVDYDPLPAVHDAVAATEAGAPQLYANVPSNLSFDWEMGDAKATDAAFAAARHVASLELVNNQVIANSMEPRPVLGVWDAAAGRTTLYSSTQGTSLIHGLLVGNILKCDAKELRCVTTDVGGGFCMTIFLYPLHCLIAWATRRLKRSIRYNPDRSEAFLADNQGRDHLSRAVAALDADGKVLAVRVTTWANLGGTLSNFAPFIPTMCGTHMITGVYDIPTGFAVIKGVLTNTTPVDAYRGAGRPEAAYLIERLVDQAAREMKLSPAELRRRNFIRPEQMPYTTSLGDVYDSGEFDTVMTKAMERAGWDGFEERRRAAKARGKVAGIGLATYVERCSGGMAETAVVKFGDDDTLTVYIGTQSNGQGHETAYKQILSQHFGVDIERLRIIQGDTDTVPSGMTGGSRSVPVGGAAMIGAADKIKEKGRRIAAHLMETAEVDVEFADGTFRVAGTDRAMSLWDVAKAAKDPSKLPEGMEPGGLDDQFTRDPGGVYTYPNGCHVCEVEIDRDTGVVEIVRYTVVDDFGGVVNPIMLMGQVHGGIVQGLGQALVERTVYDDDSGQLATGSFMDYAMPRADIVPFIDFTMHNVPCSTNPLGIKGAGEAGAIGAPPAVINALVDALQPETGVLHVDMPATPLVLWRLLNERRQRAA